MAGDPCGSHVIEKFIVAEGIKEKHKDALLNKLKVIFVCLGIGLDKKKLSVKMKFSSYPSVLSYVLGAQKNRLIETVLLSTHNICFG